MQITMKTTPTSPEERERILTSPGFGLHRTDHVLQIDYRGDAGWGEAVIKPYGSLSLDPATMGLHYGQLIFEGLKAFVQSDGSVSLFRPAENARRLNESARRLSMPTLDEELFVEAARALVEVELDWVPTGPGQSLYLRPFMFASEAHIGLRVATEYSFLILATPVDPFFSAEVRALSVWIDRDHVRAVRGGTGSVKCAGNYAASMQGKQLANEQGCDEVLWLDAIDRRWIEELGGMNVCFVYGSGDEARLVTPPLDGSILAGITRASLLELGRSRGLTVEEEPIAIDVLFTAMATGEVTEAFACGTATVVAPIGTILCDGVSREISATRPGPVTMGLRAELLAIQTGTSPAFPEWRTRV